MEEINLVARSTGMNETKKPASTHWNSFPDCAGLELSAPQGGRPEEGFGLNADLNFGRQLLSGKDVSFRLGVRSGSLRVELDRCQIVGTRFAMRDQPATVHREVKREETESKSVETKGLLAARLGLSGSGPTGEAKLSGSASGRRAIEETASYREERTEEIQKVTARGTNCQAITISGQTGACRGREPAWKGVGRDR
jgi:hypothetical protein